jgi:hypothetical protein
LVRISGEKTLISGHIILKSKDGVVIKSDEKYWFSDRNRLITMGLVRYIDREYIFEDSSFWEIMRQIKGPKIGDLVFVEGDIIKESNLKRMRIVCWSKIHDIEINKDGTKTYIFDTEKIYNHDEHYIESIGKKIRVKKDQIKLFKKHDN